jgi:hypothetical protein
MRCPFARHLATAARSAVTERATDIGSLMLDMWRFLATASMGSMSGPRHLTFGLKTTGKL